MVRHFACIISPGYFSAMHPVSPSIRNRVMLLEKIAASCGVTFIIVLAISAYWDPSIRVLHLFEAIPYAAAAYGSLRKRKVGYALGFASGSFWLWMASALTTFVRGGFERVAMLIRTGTIDRWDQFIAAPAAVATGGLALCSVWAYLRLPDRARQDAWIFITTLLSVIAYFIGMFWILAPDYLAMFAPLF